MVKFLLDYAKMLEIDAGQLLESKHDSISRKIFKNPNNKMLDSLLKRLIELENGNKTIKTLIHKYPSLSQTEEKLAFALSYIKAENKESFAEYALDIFKKDQKTIMSSAYKFSVLRDKSW